MAFDLYVFSVSPGSRAVLVLAKHLGLEVNVKEVDLLKGEQLSEEFIKVSIESKKKLIKLN